MDHCIPEGGRKVKTCCKTFPPRERFFVSCMRDFSVVSCILYYTENFLFVLCSSVTLRPMSLDSETRWNGDFGSEVVDFKMKKKKKENSNNQNCKMMYVF